VNQLHIVVGLVKLRESFRGPVGSGNHSIEMVKDTESKGLQGQLPKAPSYFDRLGQITDELLSEDDPGKLEEAATRLHGLFSEITGVDDNSDNPLDGEDILLPHGRAISPRDAARCALDFARTSQYLKGIYAAVLAAQERFPDGPVEVLYAGCGPFATLATFLTTRFSAEQIQLHLLDVHRRSLESVRRLFETLGVGNYVSQYIQTDATTYVHDAPLQIVIVEAMQRALTKEPQVAVTANLCRQLSPGGIFIPEQITVDACLYDPGKEFFTPPAEGSSPDRNQSQRFRINLGTVMDVTPENSIEWIGKTETPAVVLDIPESVERNLRLLLATRVKVFESFVLEEYDSGLTNPLLLHDVTFGGVTRLEFTYCLGSKPGFKYQWTRAGTTHKGSAI
jgi:hypothetical protein